jgi:hypothetical protein
VSEIYTCNLCRRAPLNTTALLRTPPATTYRSRRALMGSTEAACRAGITHATSATVSSTLSGKGFTREAVALMDVNIQYVLRLLAKR